MLRAHLQNSRLSILGKRLVLYTADINGKIFASGVCLKGRKKE